ncbi:hypothetical protein HNP46_001586 [Pseudomonas nitritireducens]|uniref:Class I SAM-dependent methyltransferase n=1 Tax=Pseudomonas nitroreducens TaxID=46680 RepID=A0A7W7KH48_PSENT|nr:DUF6231 family protein [Pseudomonas nitritireducens]MBB4862742.1 hypothetical protein [Pseudomonas nitritireducens]
MISSRTPQQALAALLDRYAPQRLLLVGASQIPAVDAFLAAHPDCELFHADAGALPADLAGQRYDLALLADCLEHLPRREAQQLVGGIRNLNSSRVAVLVDLDAAQAQDADFYALAMQASERFQRDAQVITLFTYDLREYKQVPDWLNAKFWANPQNFGKYWW